MSDIPPPPPGFTLIDDLPPARKPSRAAPRRDVPPPPPGFEVLDDDHPEASALLGRPTGAVHDGDTFAVDSGRNARLYGVDAFELNQTGRAPDGSVTPLGRQARGALVPFAQPSADVLATGAMTYGRPVVSLDNGGDAGRAILDQGYGLATPEYLKSDPQRFTDYMTAERGARLNHRGAFAGEFQSPADFRHKKQAPWAEAEWSDQAAPGSSLVFWDEPTPFQGLRKSVADGYVALTDDPKSTPADAMAYAKANGFELDPGDVAKYYAARKPGNKAGPVTYHDKPRVLTDLGDGELGAAVRGFGDPLNLLDEAGAAVDTLGGTPGRENVFSSDRRIADVFANNLEQNRSILANDEAKHPYIRLGGQFASGALIPTASIEGVGLNAARKVLQDGGTRFAAEAAAKAAVRARFIQAGSLEGAVMGAGAGESWSERGTGALVGSGLGAALSGAAVVGGQAAGKSVRKFLDARRAGRASAALDPEAGAFGPIHYDLADNYPAALERMRKDGAGEVPAAIKHPEVGPVDLVWGDGSYGLSKIERLHPEVVDDLPAIIERLPIVGRPEDTGNGKFVLSDDTHRAVVAPDFDGQTKRWLVTAYEREGAPGGQVSRRDPPLPPGGSGGIGAADDIAAAGAGGNTRPSPTRATGDTDPLVTPPATAARPLPANSFRGPLSAHTPTIYREMSFGGDGFGRLTMPSELAGRWRNEGGTDNLQFADTPSLATGQGANKGFVFEYDSAPFIGAPRLEKPGAPLAWQNGAGEYSTNGVTQETLQSALRGFRVKPGAREALPVADRQLFDNIAADLERKGWQRSEAADGSVVYRRPSERDATMAQRAEGDDGNVIYGPADDLAPRQRDRIDVNDRPVPLLRDATEAQRAAQSQRIAPGDVLPIPSNTVASVEEAVAASAGRYPQVRAPNERDALASRSIPSPNDGLRSIPKRGPLDLVTWLRTQGGLRPQGKELEHYGIDNAERAGMDFAGGEKRFGKLVDAENGMPYDEAADAAWKAGYFPDNVERPTISEFLDALSATHSGRNRSFHPDDHAEVDAFEAQRSLRHSVEGARERGAPLVEDRGQPVDMADLDRNAPPVTAYEEWGENAPRLAGNIRLDRLDSPQEIKRAIANTHARVGGFDAATRGRITHAETESLASELGMTPDDLLKRRKGQAFSAEEALAARQILARSSTDLVNMAKRLSAMDNPGDELEAGFRQAWVRHVAIQEQVAGMTAEAGRALSAFRVTADSRALGSRVLPSLGDIAGGTDRLKDVAARIIDLEASGVGPGGINDFTSKALKPRFRDKLIELYYNSLLSRPTTHAVNILSNTITALAQLPEHGIAAGIGGVRRGVKRVAGNTEPTDAVIFGEIGSRATGMIQGAREGLREAGRTFMTGQPRDAVTKVEQRVQEAIGGRAGKFIRTPTRALAAEDEFFKAVARRSELAGLSMRMAKAEGLKGAALKERAAALLANPTDDMIAKSFDYARYVTFQQPLGQAGQAISRFTEAHPITKLIIPFVRTPTNILKFAIERTPAAPLLKEWRRDILAGGAKRDVAIARLTMGTGIAAWMYQLASEGKITGGGPADENALRLLKADGWQPYSLKVGDRYYSYQRLDPYSTVIGTAADLVDQERYMTDKQREDASLRVGAAVLKNLSNKTWLLGLSTALEALNDPDRSAGNFVARTAGAVAVPGLVAGIQQAVDPVQRAPQGVLERIRSRVPGMSSALLPRRDVFGRPVAAQSGLGPDILSPIWTGTDRKDKTIDALLAVGARISLPSRHVAGRDLTPIEYDQYQVAVGDALKPSLDALTQGPTWNALPVDDRRDMIDDVVRTARRNARRQLFGGAGGADIPPPPPGYSLVGQ